MIPSPFSGKIIFIAPLAPTVDFSAKFFVSELRAHGLDLEYWDVSALMGYEMRFRSDVASVHYILIKSYRDFWRMLHRENKKTTIFAPQITRDAHSLWIYLTLSLFTLKTIFWGRGYLPLISEPRTTGIVARIKELLTYKNKWTIIRSALARRLLSTQKYDVTFVAGRLAEKIHQKDSVLLVPIHHFDIDRTMTSPTESMASSQPYGVFLDDYLPFHPDFSIGQTETINPDSYYTALNAYFSWIESELCIKILIAAHPKANYVDNPFNDRIILSGQTDRLVRDAKIAFLHGSTSISFAIIYQKPVCLMYSADIQKKHPLMYDQMHETSKLLGCPLIDFEHDRDTLPIKDVSMRKYAKFYDEFLSCRTDTTPSAALVINAVETLLSEKQNG
jgi:hypothetical protein